MQVFQDVVSYFGKKISRDGKGNLANIIGLFEKFVMVSPLALWLIAGN